MFFGKKEDATDKWKKTGSGSEMRTNPRMPLKTLVTVRYLNREAHCKLHDLSLGGMAFIAPWQLSPDDPVVLIFPPPEGLIGPKVPKNPAFLDARVCRVIPSPKYPGMFQTGVRFVKPSPESQEVVRLWFEMFGEAPDRGGGTARRGR